MPDSLPSTTEVQITVARFCILGRHSVGRVQKEMGEKSPVKKTQTSRPGGDDRGATCCTHSVFVNKNVPEGTQTRRLLPPFVNLTVNTLMTTTVRRISSSNRLSIQTGHLEYLIPLPILLSPITYQLGRI